MFELEKLVRKNIQRLQPYSCARDEFRGVHATVYADANENPYNSPLNRYPDPLQEELKKKISPIKSVPVDNIFLGNGSDEAIDIVYRIFCDPGTDNAVAIDPTYGMYEVCADINDVEYRKVPLDKDFHIDSEKVLSACDAHTKVIWICSPNNPSGNNIGRKGIMAILEKFEGIVVVDEAYSDFSPERPFRLDLHKYPNLIVLNTFSKAWAGAAIRLGLAYASKEIISLFNKVKYPYNINRLTQEKAKDILSNQTGFRQHLMMILEERNKLISALSKLPICKHIYPSDSNFFLMEVTDADAIYHYLIDKGIVVRNRSKVNGCSNCLRITVGTKHENSMLLSALIKYQPSQPKKI